MNTKVLLFLAAAVFCCALGQDLELIQTRGEQLSGQEDLSRDYPLEVLEHLRKSVDQLTKLWTDPESAEGLLADDSFPNQCLQAAWNLSYVNDAQGVPLLVDVIDSFGKLGAGQCSVFTCNATSYGTRCLHIVCM